MPVQTPPNQALLLSKAEVDQIVYQCRQSGADSTYDIVQACLREAMVKASPMPGPTVLDALRAQNNFWHRRQQELGVLSEEGSRVWLKIKDAIKVAESGRPERLSEDRIREVLTPVFLRQDQASIHWPDIVEEVRAIEDALAVAAVSQPVLHAPEPVAKIDKSIPSAEIQYTGAAPEGLPHGTELFLAPDGLVAERYQALRQGRYFSVIDGAGGVLTGDDLDAAVDRTLEPRTLEVTGQQERNPPDGFGPERIVWELNQTALGNAFYGSALRAAMDLDFLEEGDVEILQRYATGAQKSTDHVGLQDIAIRIHAAMVEPVNDAAMSAKPRG